MCLLHSIEGCHETSHRPHQPQNVILYGPQCTNYGGGQPDQTLCLDKKVDEQWKGAAVDVNEVGACERVAPVHSLTC